MLMEILKMAQDEQIALLCYEAACHSMRRPAADRHRRPAHQNQRFVSVAFRRIQHRLEELERAGHFFRPKWVLRSSER